MFLNSPGNPTGWTITPEDLDAVVEHCRRHRVWLVTDDAYSRLYYDHPYAPYAPTRTEPDDLVILLGQHLLQGLGFHRSGRRPSRWLAP